MQYIAAKNAANQQLQPQQPDTFTSSTLRPTRPALPQSKPPLTNLNFDPESINSSSNKSIVELEDMLSALQANMEVEIAATRLKYTRWQQSVKEAIATKRKGDRSRNS